MVELQLEVLPVQGQGSLSRWIMQIEVVPSTLMKMIFPMLLVEN